MRPSPRRTDSVHPTVRLRPRLVQLEDRYNPTPVLLQSFDTISAEENLALNLFAPVPSDVHGAVGPNHVLVTTNTSIGWYSKQGVKQVTMPLTSGNPTPEFWAPLGPSLVGVFDPKAFYDTYSGRFVVVGLDSDQTTESRLLIAVSKTSDPNNGFNFQAVDVFNLAGANEWFDYPGFGADESGIYITGNLFTPAGAYSGTRVIILDKGMYSGGTSTVQRLDPFATSGVAPTTLQVAALEGPRPAGTSGSYLVGYRSNTGLGGAAGNDEAIVIRVDNPTRGATFALTRVNLGDVDESRGQLSPAPQQGSNNRVATNDNRALAAVWRNDTLTFVNTVDPPSGVDNEQATAHWAQIRTTGGAPTILYQGNVGGEEIGPATSTYFPSVAVDKFGRIGIGFAASNASIFPSSFFTVIRRPENGLASDAFQTKAGTRFTTDPRWGDYSATVLDPTDSTFWQISQYSAPSAIFGDQWVTYAAQIDAGPVGSYAVAADAGGGPNVQVFSRTGVLQQSFNAYSATFTGGVRVALADVNGDQIPDIITVPGSGGGPNVRVFDGRTLQLLYSFQAYDPRFTNGLTVAAGDLDGDGRAEIVTGADAGGGPNVRVFKLGPNGKVTLASSFYAYSAAFTGGVRVAVGDFNNDGAADIVTSPGFGGGPNVRVFDGRAALAGQTVLLKSFMAGSASSTYGAYVAVGNLNGDGVLDFVVGSGAGNREVGVYDGRTLGLLNQYTAYQPAQSSPKVLGENPPVGGLIAGTTVPGQLASNTTEVVPAASNPTRPFAGQRVAVADIDGDGNDDILSVGGPGDLAVLRFRNGRSLAGVLGGTAPLFGTDRLVFSSAFTGGAFVAASR